MDEETRNQEKEITKLMMETFNFSDTKSGVSVKCNSCGKIYSRFYVGKGLNERMIEHYERNHKWSE